MPAMFINWQAIYGKQTVGPVKEPFLVCEEKNYKKPGNHYQTIAVWKNEQIIVGQLTNVKKYIIILKKSVLFYLIPSGVD